MLLYSLVWMELCTLYFNSWIVEVSLFTYYLVGLSGEFIPKIVLMASRLLPLPELSCKLVQSIKEAEV